MADEVEIVEAEDLGPLPSANRDSIGRLLPGHPALGSRPKGAKGRVSHFLLESFAEYVGEDPDRNPVKILIDIAMGRALNSKGEPIEIPVSVRATAASRLLATFLPSGSSVKIGDTINVDARRVEAVSKALNDPQARGLAELLARRVAAGMPVASSGRLINVSENAPPRPQAAIEAAPDAGGGESARS